MLASRNQLSSVCLEVWTRCPAVCFRLPILLGTLLQCPHPACLLPQSPWSLLGSPSASPLQSSHLWVSVLGFTHAFSFLQMAAVITELQGFLAARVWSWLWLVATFPPESISSSALLLPHLSCLPPLTPCPQVPSLSSQPGPSVPPACPHDGHPCPSEP